MKVYIAKDWRGCHVFANIPKLLKCGGMLDIWSGHELKEFNINSSFIEDEIPLGKYLERNILWSIVHIIE